ncbi:MAG: 1,4-alpha-glucan branching protein GlgB [Nitrospirota bacterium]|nr:1,4-alpha-glucan branching protein GlgB [Nitrospirota bacterium]
MSVEMEKIDQLIRAELWDPFSVLGPHEETGQGKDVVIRAFCPDATGITVVPKDSNVAPLPMQMVNPAGVYEAKGPAQIISSGYRLRVTHTQGETVERHDPYAFPPLLSEYDLHLFGEGKLYRAYEKFGAHVRTQNGVQGIHFTVWAPNARRVSVVGDFNGWDGRQHPMQTRGGTGVWELFVPDLGDGEHYKYEIRPKDSAVLLLKADPYAAQAELRPKTASVARDLSGYRWRDSKWMIARQNRDVLALPISIYEVHLGSWRRVQEEGNRWLTYLELAEQLIPYVKYMGFTHIELMPVAEHPFDGSWGYQSTGYFAPTSRFGPAEDFMAFVDQCHQEGLGVILDWAPAHFPDDAHGLALFDGTHLYDHSDPRMGYHPEWKSRIFNYSRTEVRNFLINSALIWFDRYHIDGLRVDAVASMLYLDYARPKGQWVPNHYGGNENLGAVEFLKELNTVVHEEYPGIMMLAEESTAWPGVSRPAYVGGLGFTFKWNMGWMHDTLEYFSLEPIHRKYHQNKVTFGLVYAFTENFLLVLSHDEVVHGKKSLLDKMPGDHWQRFANLRAMYGHMWSHPGKKMLFMGGEFGQWFEWNHEDSLQWHLAGFESHRGLQQYVADLNRLYVQEPALHEVDFDWTGFQWIDLHDSEQSTLSYMRKAKDQSDIIVCVFNFTPVPRYDHRVGVPSLGKYKELINSDAEVYGGSNVGNQGATIAEDVPWHGQPHSMVITLPPLSALFFKPAVPRI